jgi:hypothetical protein
VRAKGANTESLSGISAHQGFRKETKEADKRCKISGGQRSREKGRVSQECGENDEQ